MKRNMTLGIGLALVTAAISGVAVFLNSFAVKALPDPAVFTLLKNGVAAAVLLAITLPRARTISLAPMRRRDWLGMALVGIFGGGVAFLLFFTGLATASAPSAAFIHKTLFIWVALLAVPLLGERLGALQIGALGVLFVSQLLIIPPSGVVWGSGETMIAIATLIWAGQVIVARRLLVRVPPLALGLGRLGIGLVVIVGFVVANGSLGSIAAIGPTGWLWVLVTGGLLAGYVASWFGALRFAPATVVTSVLVLAAPITALLSSLSAGSLPQLLPLTGYLLVAVGVAVVIALNGRRSATVSA